MFLSDRDLEYASSLDDLLIIPRPTEFDASGIDLHLDTIAEAKVWDPKRRTDFLRGGRGSRGRASVFTILSTRCSPSGSPSRSPSGMGRANRPLSTARGEA